jgi:hypothetical protein
LIIYCNAQISPLFSDKIIFTKSQFEISAQKSKIAEMAFFTHFPSQISMVWPGLQWLGACSRAENVCFALYQPMIEGCQWDAGRKISRALLT